MKCIIDLDSLIGQTFGELTIEKAWREVWWKHQYIMAQCKCSCGGTYTGKFYRIKRGERTHCGCKVVRVAHPAYTHRGSKTRLYKIYRGMIARCNYPNTSSFPRYGGRGISVCVEWMKSFSTFREWAQTHGYTDELSIERINVNGNYEPSNCSWIPLSEQSKNTRANRRITIDHETHLISEWADISGVPRWTIRRRIDRGWTEKDAVFIDKSIKENPNERRTTEINTEVSNG